MRFAIFHNIADVARAYAQALRGDHGVLRGDQRVVHSEQQIARARLARRAVRVGKRVVPFLAIGAENERHLRAGDKGLVVASFGQARAQGGIRDVQNRIQLLIARRGRHGGGAQNRRFVLRGNLPFLKGAHGFARVQLTQSFV